jgi:hypothetical protein
MSKENIDQVILVVRRFQVGSMKADYRVEKWATSLSEASKYQVSLETLNDDKENTSYHLFNGFGVLHTDAKFVATKPKEESEEEDDRISF